MVEPIHNRTVGSGELGSLLDGVVGGSIQKDHAVSARKDGQDTAVEQGDGWEQQNVRSPDKPRNLLLQVFEDLLGGHSARPAWVHAPTFYRLDHRSLNRGM